MLDISSTCIIKFLNEVFKRESFPNSVLSDNSPQFYSAKFEDYLKTFAIKHQTFSVYHPETNGAMERLNKTLKSIQFAKANNIDWRIALQE